jgi:hypothetical protein
MGGSCGHVFVYRKKKGGFGENTPFTTIGRNLQLQGGKKDRHQAR